jgi:farnesyl diphosphate synthase
MVRQLTDRETKDAHILGWCIEIVNNPNLIIKLQACFLIADDIMDSSETRRGVPCRYKQHGIIISIKLQE